MRYVAKAVAFDDGNLTIVERVRRNMEALVLQPYGWTTTKPTDRRCIISRVTSFNAHRDESLKGVRAVEGIAIDSRYIVDETLHFDSLVPEEP